MLSSGWKEKRIESISCIQQTIIKYFPYARSCEDGIVVSRDESEAQKNVMNPLVSGCSSESLAPPSEPLHMLSPGFDPLFLHVFMWLAASIIQGSAQLSPPHGGPPWSHYSTSLHSVTWLWYKKNFFYLKMASYDLIYVSITNLSIRLVTYLPQTEWNLH